MRLLIDVRHIINEVILPTSANKQSLESDQAFRFVISQEI